MSSSENGLTGTAPVGDGNSVVECSAAPRLRLLPDGRPVRAVKLDGLHDSDAGLGIGVGAGGFTASGDHLGLDQKQVHYISGWNNRRSLLSEEEMAPAERKRAGRVMIAVVIALMTLFALLLMVAFR